MYSPEEQLEIQKKLKKFIQDKDWAYVEELILSYVIDAVSINNIPSNLSNDQIASEVRGRQLLFQRFTQFLNETGLVKQEKTDELKKQVSFK